MKRGRSEDQFLPTQAVAETTAQRLIQEAIGAKRRNESVFIDDIELKIGELKRQDANLRQKVRIYVILSV